ncbi:DUF4159 domain-containing protein [Minwuia sp.]|uniref:DUF4159 domain-containing protein n=1 Tax=Minwuia sp. TaxID=2493630 RepID=UPI003A90C516
MSALLAGFTFGQPLILLGLLSLPVIWWLLKATPPAPERIVFPPARLIFEMVRREETPHRTPWWLLLLRLLIAALLVFGLARPVLNPGGAFSTSGPVLLIVDDGWAAAQSWQDRVATLVDLTNRADREERAVALLRTTPDPDGVAPKLEVMSAIQARNVVRAIVPRPWAPDYAATVSALENADLDRASNIFWLTSGIELDGAADLARTARRLGSLTVIDRAAGQSVMLVRSVDGEGATVRAIIERDAPSLPETATVTFSADDGRILMRRDLEFASGETRLELSETLPVEALNQVARVSIEGRDSPGAMALVDSGLRRDRVGLTGTLEPERAQPLLSDVYYLKRALGPFAEIVEGEVAQLLDRPLSMLVLADVGQIVEGDRLRLADWIERGGVLLRFAGPRLAEGEADLLPVTIRQGDRTLQGAMSWSQPARLAPFPENSPFRGLTVSRDISVSRQVLAEPTLDLPEKTWARLEDGTPLVTAEARGEGWLVLVHTSANTAWSNLALSGLFVEMLRRISALSIGIEEEARDRNLAPVRVLDGFGRSTEPGPSVRPVNEAEIANTPVGPRHPPGLYGEPAIARAMNIGARAPELAPLTGLPDSIRRNVIGGQPETNLGPALLTAAVALLIIDLLLALMLRGLLRLPRGGLAAGALVLLMGVPGDPAAAQEEPVNKSVVAAALDTRLAYVLTGNDAVDSMSAAGMFGLTEIMLARTSVEPESPKALDIESDELIFYPVIYWPMTREQPALSDPAIRRLAAYLRTGGVVLFDTRDDGSPLGSGRSAGPGTMRLRQLLSRIDIGPLDPVGDGHVLTRSFYLMDVFPGRFRGGRIWAERLDSSANDGVSPLIIGGADWAAAWAMDRSGRPIAALRGGGERQREMAYRFGVNLVMYALTGNYKADQVHVPAILERLGQ